MLADDLIQEQPSDEFPLALACQTSGCAPCPDTPDSVSISCACLRVSCSGRVTYSSANGNICSRACSILMYFAAMHCGATVQTATGSNQRISRLIRGIFCLARAVTLRCGKRPDGVLVLMFEEAHESDPRRSIPQCVVRLLVWEAGSQALCPMRKCTGVLAESKDCAWLVKQPSP